MQRWVSSLFVGATIFTMSLSSVVFAQAPPADFLLRATSGGRAPWSQATTITIDGLGHAIGTRYNLRGVNPILAETTFAISSVKVQQLWKSIQDSSFFGLASQPPDTTISDGAFAKITVTANGASHQVIVRNAAQPQVQSLMDSVNVSTPPSFHLLYQPPAKLNSVWRDPCAPLLGSLRFDPRRGNKPIRSSALSMSVQMRASSASPGALGLPASSASSSSLRSLISSIESVVIPHPGSVVAYDVPVEEAVAANIATLKSKGQGFGDAISLSVDNRVPKPSDVITITLYLEFWGPLAWQGNVDPIVNDILSKWSGHKTSSGKEVHVEVITRLNWKARVPPNTPGYDDILLKEPDSVRSHVHYMPGVVSGNGDGVWEVAAAKGTYAHEVGHLMGLPDRYDEYNRQADGSWVNATTGTKYANDDLLAPYYASKNPGTSVADAKAFLSTLDLVCMGRDGFDNDMMNNNQTVSQSDIDLITTNPGILVRVPNGAALVNKAGDAQNVVVTHAEDFFVKPGEQRSLNGIYGACIDYHKSIPDNLTLFDVAPPVDGWRGMAAASIMSQFLHFIDTAGVYCASNFAVQEAIWRITDNSLLFFDQDAQAMLGLAGIHLGDQILEFPHLSARSSKDSTSLSYVPDELFAADIQPRFVNGSPGTKVTFNASVSQPLGPRFTTDVSWTANGSDTASLPMSGSGSSGSMTPPRSGVYEIGLIVSVTDSALLKRTFKAPGKAYVIVPDSNTETFEHAHLADKFPWRTYGDVPWGISTAHAQTGNSSAQPGSLGLNQTSVLAIDLALPVDGVVTFSMRTATVEFTNQCQFSIDSVFVNEYSGMKDWTISSYPLKAGPHTLAWTCTGSVGAAGNEWLDNVFFPPHSVVTSALASESSVPSAFLLYQNYPNPFNPATTIRYSIPASGSQSTVVTLSVFDVLGREVAVLVNERKTAGSYTVKFDGSRYSSGLYYYRMSAGSFVQTRAMVLTK